MQTFSATVVGGSLVGGKASAEGILGPVGRGILWAGGSHGEASHRTPGILGAGRKGFVAGNSSCMDCNPWAWALGNLPRTETGSLGYGQELHMGLKHIARIRDKSFIEAKCGMGLYRNRLEKLEIQ